MSRLASAQIDTLGVLANAAKGETFKRSRYWIRVRCRRCGTDDKAWWVADAYRFLLPHLGHKTRVELRTIPDPALAPQPLTRTQERQEAERGAIRVALRDGEASTAALSERCAIGRVVILKRLNAMLADDEIERSEGGGRGRATRWRLA